MRKIHSYITAIFSLVVCFGTESCTNCAIDGESRLFSREGCITFRATAESSGSRTEIQSDGSVVWSKEDSIKVFCLGNSGKFVSSNTTPSNSVDFSGNLVRDTNLVWALYPYQSDAVFKSDLITMKVPHIQYANQGTFSSAAFPCVAKTETTSLNFLNVCGGAKIQLSRDDIYKIEFIPVQPSSAVAGRVSVGFEENVPVVKTVVEQVDTVTFLTRDGSCFISGVPYYLTLLPCTLNCGFEINFISKEQIVKYSYHSPVVISRSKFGRLYNLDKQSVNTPTDYENLSFAGTANCYIVNKAGNYCFDGTVKGGSNESVGNPVSAEVLWESFGTSIAPSVGDIVKNVSYSNGYVKFSTPSTLANGNAVIAVKDTLGTILWSWHIWVCKDFNPKTTSQLYNNNAGILMDRNLGATSATPGDVRALGLLYQWGRKDPFLASSSINSNTEAQSTITWPASVVSNASVGKINYATAHPTTFIKRNSLNSDWYYTGSSSTDTTRWQTMKDAKGLYDPCPYGWRVPEGGPDGVWSIAFGTSSRWFLSTKQDTTLHGIDFGSTDYPLCSGAIWYPASGCRHYSSGSITNTGVNGYQWTCSNSEDKAYYMYYYYIGTTYPSSTTFPAYGRSVRCVSESSDFIFQVTGVKIQSKYIYIEVGSAGAQQLSVTFFPSYANTNTTITWRSTDTSIATVSSTGMVEGVREGICYIIAQTYNGIEDSCQVEVIMPATSYEDLSSRGTANCYIVSKAGSFCFKGTVKGGSKESVGTIATTEVLWESYGTDIEPSKGDIVKTVLYSDGYIKFSTPSTLTNGNAVIAVKDASGTILWSWHIWVCKDFYPDATAQKYAHNAGILMDRNLGATSVTPGDVKALGLMYQWGRKDPFLSLSRINTDTEAKSTITWPPKLLSTSLYGTIEYTTAHPTTFIKYNTFNNDWYYADSSSVDTTRWQTMNKAKGVYDPCPYGWRVPEGGPDGVWSVAFGTCNLWNVSAFHDTTLFGIDFGSIEKPLGDGVIWYPETGYRYSSSGVFRYTYCGYQWSCSNSGISACVMYFNNSGTINPSTRFSRATGLPVRCISESSPSIIPVTSVNVIESNIDLTEGDTKQLTVSVIPSNANNTDIHWESTDETVAVVSTTGLVRGVGEGDCQILATAYNGTSDSCRINVPSSLDSYDNLSSNGTANCYVVNRTGKFRFDGTVKGESAESVGNPKTAEVLWESFGTDVIPSVGDIVKDVTYSNGYVKFSTPSTLQNGNAVIAVKDSSGTILWSWHIWVCKDFDPMNTAQVYNNNAGTMMDRNLGATSAAKGDVHSLGLLYQWGRKDPFLGSSSISAQTVAKSTITWPSAVDSTNGTISYAIAHPTTFIINNNNNNDWYYSGTSSTDNTRWQTSSYSKGIFDPCPKGWRVPDGGLPGIWKIGFGTNNNWTSLSNWDDTNKGMDFGSTDKTLGSGTIWYPAAGWSINGLLNSIGSAGYYRSCYENYIFLFNNDGTIYPLILTYRSLGLSVRCQLDENK